MRPESYDAVACAPGAYVEFRRGVQHLVNHSVPFIVKGALLPHNQGEMAEFDAWAATIPWMNEPPGYSLFFDLRGRRDLPARNRVIERLRVSPEEGVAILEQRVPDLPRANRAVLRALYRSGRREAVHLRGGQRRLRRLRMAGTSPACCCATLPWPTPPKPAACATR